MSDMWFVYQSDNFEGAQFNNEIFTDYDLALKQVRKDVKKFIEVQIDDEQNFKVSRTKNDKEDAYLVEVKDGNSNYDDYYFSIVRFEEKGNNYKNRTTDVNMFYKVMSYYESDPSMISTDGYFKDYEKAKEYIYKGNKQIVEGVKSNSVTTFKNIISDEHYEIHKVFFNDSEV